MTTITLCALTCPHGSRGTYPGFPTRVSRDDRRPQRSGCLERDVGVFNPREKTPVA